MDSDLLGEDALIDQAHNSSPRSRKPISNLEHDVHSDVASEPSSGPHETGEYHGAEAQEAPQSILPNAPIPGSIEEGSTASDAGRAVGIRLFSGMGREQPVANAPPSAPSGGTPSQPMSGGLIPKLYSGMRGPEETRPAAAPAEAQAQNVPAPVRLSSGLRGSDPSRSFKRGLPDACTVDRPAPPSRLWANTPYPDEASVASPTALRRDPAVLERLAQQPPTPVGMAVSPKGTSRFDCSADADSNVASKDGEGQGGSGAVQERPGGWGKTGEEGESRPPSWPQSEDGGLASAHASLHSSLRSKEAGASTAHVSLPPPTGEEEQGKRPSHSPTTRRAPPMLNIPTQLSSKSLLTGRSTPTTSRSTVVNASIFPALIELPPRYSGSRGEGQDGMLLTPRSAALAPTLPIWNPKESGKNSGIRSPLPVPTTQACHVGVGPQAAVAANRDSERRRRSFTAGMDDDHEEGPGQGAGAFDGTQSPALRGVAAIRRLARVGTTMLAPRVNSSSSSGSGGGGVGLQEGALTEVLQRLGALDLNRRITPNATRRLPGDESIGTYGSSSAYLASASSFRGPTDDGVEEGDEPTLLEECLQRLPSAFDVAGFDPEVRPLRGPLHDTRTRQPSSPAVDDEAPQAFVDDQQEVLSSGPARAALLSSAPCLPPLGSTASAGTCSNERKLPPPLASSLQCKNVDTSGASLQTSRLRMSQGLQSQRRVSQGPQGSQLDPLSCPPIMPIHVSGGPKAADTEAKPSLRSGSGRAMPLSQMAMALSVSTQQPMPFSPVKPSGTPQAVRSRRALSEAFLQDKTRALSSDELRTVAVFVPSLVVDLVLAGGDYKPFGVDLDDVAVLLVDISGFTKLCEACANGTLTLSKQQESDDAQASLELARVNSIHASAVGARMFRMSNQAEVEGFGAENVREILNHYFGVLVEIIYRYDGDVIRIAGDALICLFAAPPTSPETGRLAPPPSSSRKARRSTLQRALKCAEACVSAIHAIRTPDIPLHVHVGVGWGSVRCYHVGSDELGWQMVVSGDPLNQVGEAIELAAGGECVVSPQTWAEAAKHHLQIDTEEELAGGFHRLVIADDSHLDEEEGNEGEVDELGDPVQRAPGLSGDSARANMLARLRQGGISEAGKRKLLGYTPILVHAGVLEEGTGLQSEIRNVTVMFLLIDTTPTTVSQSVRQSSGSEGGSVVYRRKKKDLTIEAWSRVFDAIKQGTDTRVDFSVLQSAFALAQATIIEHEGLLKELSVDDKGLVLVAGFGLHSVVSDNFASSACKAALALCFGLNLLRLGAHVGLATGRVFCASLGNRERREFALVSDTVNTAARLMSLGMKGGAEYTLSREQLCRIDPHRAHGLHSDVAGSVVVERHTYARADVSPNLDFASRPPVSVKGKSVMLEVYLPSLSSHDGLLLTRRLADELPCIEPMAHDEFVSRCLALFDVREVEEQLLDILWVRSEGNSLYLNLLADKIKALLATRPHNSNPDQAHFCALPSHDHAFIQSVASVVPEGLQEVFSRRLACLPRAHVIVLKVLCVLGEGSLCLVLHLFHSLPSLSRYWAAQRSNTTARRRITADRANNTAQPLADEALHSGASHSTPRTPDPTTHAQASGQTSTIGPKGGSETDATSPRPGVSGIHVPPIMPASPLIADTPMTRAELLGVFRLLQRYGFLDFDASTECYSLREPLLIDYLYTSIPFRQRVAFHGLAAEWMLEYTGHKIGNAALLYPLLMHHLSMAFQEARSASIMQLLQVLGPSYLETWVLLRLSECPRFVDVASCGGPRAKVMQRGMGCLSAFPWLRGLARVMHANRVASKVVSFVSQLKSRWLRRVAERRLASQRVAYAPHIRASKIQSAWRRTHDRKRERAGDGGEENRKLPTNVLPQGTDAAARPTDGATSTKINNSGDRLTPQAATGMGGNATLRSPHSPKNSDSTGGVAAEKASLIGTEKPNGLNMEAHGLEGLRSVLSPNESLRASKHNLATSVNNGAVDPSESLRSNEQTWR